MLNQVTKIAAGGKDILLVGTAHVSAESVELVRKVIDEEKPDAVAVELDAQRYESLVNKKKWDETEIHKVLSEKKTQLFLLQLLLSNFQRKIGDRLGVKPGAEMAAAVEEAKKRNIRVELVDRDIRTTLKRAFAKMSLKEKFKMLYGFVSGIFEEEELEKDMLEKLKDNDVMTELMAELSREIPSIKEVLIDERDSYITEKILAAEGKRIVAVVGAGHVEGIKKRLESGGRTDIKKLETLPEGGRFWKYVGYAIPAIFLIILVYGFYTNGANITIELLVRWFLITGTFAAIGAAAALAHPLSIITAFVAAPFTTLHPALAAGWFSGLAEAWVRKPKVRDFDELYKLNSMSDYWKNGVTRILLVMAFTNIGATIGVVVGLPYLATLLHI
jgi:pheromone shutdown-related protein TraB